MKTIGLFLLMCVLVFSCKKTEIEDITPIEEKEVVKEKKKEVENNDTINMIDTITTDSIDTIDNITIDTIDWSGVYEGYVKQYNTRDTNKYSVTMIIEKIDTVLFGNNILYHVVIYNTTNKYEDSIHTEGFGMQYQTNINSNKLFLDYTNPICVRWWDYLSNTTSQSWIEIDSITNKKHGIFWGCYKENYDIKLRYDFYELDPSEFDGHIMKDL